MFESINKNYIKDANIESISAIYKQDKQWFSKLVSKIKINKKISGRLVSYKYKKVKTP